jgi:protein CpxP
MPPIFRQAALAALVALGAASIAAPAAWAQDDHRGQRPSPDQMHARMQQMREAHERQYAADLRTILRLRPDQDAALTAYLDSHKRPDGAGRPSGDHRGPADRPMAPMTTTQRLDEMARRETEHAAMQKRHADALRAFYAALSPEQRQVFDALQRMHGGHGRGGWGHHGFGGGMRGPMGGGKPGGPPQRDD